MDRDFSFNLCMAGPTALRTPFFRHPSPPAALRTGAHAYELTERGLAHLAHLARTATLRTGYRFFVELPVPLQAGHASV